MKHPHSWWSFWKRVILGQIGPMDGVPQDELLLAMHEATANWAVGLAGFIFLATSHRAFQLEVKLSWPRNWIPIVILAVVGVFLMVQFIRFCLYRIPTLQIEKQLLWMNLAAVVDIGVFAYLDSEGSEPMRAANFIAFCSGLVMLRYRHLLLIFLSTIFISVVCSRKPFDSYHFEFLISEALTGALILLVFLRAKNEGSARTCAARLKMRIQSRQLEKTVEQLRHENTERRNAEQRLKDSQEELRALSREVIRIQEKERAHLSRELHDELGQTLTAVRLSLDGIRRYVDPPTAQSIEETNQLLAEAIRQVRDLATELRPSLLDQLGLEAAIQWSVDRLRGRSPMVWSFESENGHPRFPIPIEAACFRIAQEAMTNAVRHASPAHVAVRCLTTADELRVSVEDDGAGFDFAARSKEGLGLVGMRERAEALGGQLLIRSKPGQGSKVEVSFRRAIASEVNG